MTSWWTHLLTISVPVAFGMAVVLLAAVAWGRHAFTDDYPPAIRDRVAPPTRRELIAAWVWGACSCSPCWPGASPRCGHGPPAPEVADCQRSTEAVWRSWRSSYSSIWYSSTGSSSAGYGPPGSCRPARRDADGWDDYAFHVKACLTPNALAMLVVEPAVLLVPVALLT